jgi:putative Ca2+/H+ antiporter (TMEM165/GDT1 family)
LSPNLAVDFGTVTLTILIAELTDKDALLLLSLATKGNPWTVFAAGSTAFTITTAIIVTAGYLLLRVVPVPWIKFAGGAIMVGYAFYQYFRAEEEEIQREERRLTGLRSENSSRDPERARKRIWRSFFGAIAMLAVLDLAGDATEVLTVVFVARYQNIILVFFGCVLALVVASAIETAIGTRVGRFLSIRSLKILSLVVFLVIGSLVVLSSLLPSLIPFF